MITTLEQAKEALVSVPLRGINCKAKIAEKCSQNRKKSSNPNHSISIIDASLLKEKTFSRKNLKNSGANRSKISRADGSLKWGSHPKVGNCLAGPKSQTSLIPSPPLQTALPFILPKPMNPGELRHVKNNFSVQVSSPKPKGKTPIPQGRFTGEQPHPTQSPPQKNPIPPMKNSKRS